MGKKEIYYCDICEEEGVKEKSHSIQVIFVTEQTEGTSVDPYLQTVDLDICGGCLDRRLSGEDIIARGAQGNNDYRFRSESW